MDNGTGKPGIQIRKFHNAKERGARREAKLAAELLNSHSMAMARRGTIGWPIAIQIVTNFQPDTAAQAISNGQLYGQTCGAHLSFIVRFIHASSLLARSPSLSLCFSLHVLYLAYTLRGELSATQRSALGSRTSGSRQSAVGSGESAGCLCVGFMLCMCLVEVFTLA